MQSGTMGEKHTEAELSIGIIGGGLAGSYCAYLLASKGKKVTLLDMGRSGVGGPLILFRRC